MELDFKETLRTSGHQEAAWVFRISRFGAKLASLWIFQHLNGIPPLLDQYLPQTLTCI
jgi:hypothetical protein